MEMLITSLYQRSPVVLFTKLHYNLTFNYCFVFFSVLLSLIFEIKSQFGESAEGFHHSSDIYCHQITY